VTLSSNGSCPRWLRLSKNSMVEAVMADTS
jgi:hypothetical protein